MAVDKEARAYRESTHVNLTLSVQLLICCVVRTLMPPCGLITAGHHALRQAPRTRLLLGEL